MFSTQCSCGHLFLGRLNLVYCEMLRVGQLCHTLNKIPFHVQGCYLFYFKFLCCIVVSRGAPVLNFSPCFLLLTVRGLVH